MEPEPGIQRPKEVALVINLRSRTGTAASQQAAAELERCGLLVRRNHLVTNGHALIESVRQVIDSGLKTIVVGGGDGTLSSAADLLANRSDLTLGILPVGTGNEMAHTLGIPLDLPGACDVIAHGRVETVDLAEASGNYFIHTALVGYPAQVNHTIPNWLKLRFGKAAYVYSFCRAMFGARPFRVAVKVGNESWEGQTILVTVGNGRFHSLGSVLLPPDRAVESGLMVYTPRSTNWLTLARLAFGLWITRKPQPSLLLFQRADSVSIVADPPQGVDLDGEFGRLTPVVVRLAKNALRVLVPNM